VLGAVSLTWLDRKRVESRMRKLAFGGAAAALVVAYLGVVMLQGPGTRLMQRVLGGGLS